MSDRNEGMLDRRAFGSVMGVSAGSLSNRPNLPEPDGARGAQQLWHESAVRAYIEREYTAGCDAAKADFEASMERLAQTDGEFLTRRDFARVLGMSLIRLHLDAGRPEPDAKRGRADLWKRNSVERYLLDRLSNACSDAAAMRDSANEALGNAPRTLGRRLVA